ncbi:MAG TPA: GNAT family N-acetyltransferase [Candidatus Bilamarchaeum sp.]|nr:GNAT family N-acetyltransferase [Candidatus Bilamarchaeum sp.]
MDVFVRKYSPPDDIVGVYRDSLGSLRKSAGGSHPDDYVDRMLSRSDGQLMRALLYANELFVAEAGGAIAGMGGFAARLKHRILGSVYSANFYVRREFQHGKSGISVGSLLRNATIEHARRLGFRKMYGYSTEEAISFHKKHGAVFYPEHNVKIRGTGITVHYYEISLKSHPLNGIRIEPYFSEQSFLSKVVGMLRGKS